MYGEDIIIGVFSGVLASSFIFLFVRIFQNIILPWYQGLSYQGIDIGGDWEMEQDFDETKEYLLFSIKQKANKVFGILTITIETKSNDTREIKIFNVEGIIQDRFLTINGKTETQNKLGI